MSTVSVSYKSEGVLIHTPSSIEDAVSMVGEGWMPLAGGTDIVPRLSWNLLQPIKLISLGSLPDLSDINKHGDILSIGSTAPLNDIADHPGTPPWLRDAIERTATTIIRNRATLTGNILQGRRCRYYNRPHHWRAVAGSCRRMGGSACFAGNAGPGCVAALKSLIAAVLVASRATVEIRASCGNETIDLYSLYSRTPLVDDLRAGGLITAIHVPLNDETSSIRSAVLARRTSFDFPEIAVAVNQSNRDRGNRETTIVITAPLPKPSVLVTTELSGRIEDEIAEWVRSIIPEATTGLYSPGYLRKAAEVLIQRTMKGMN